MSNQGSSSRVDSGFVDTELELALELSKKTFAQEEQVRQSRTTPSAIDGADNDNMQENLIEMCPTDPAVKERERKIEEIKRLCAEIPMHQLSAQPTVGTWSLVSAVEGQWQAPGGVQFRALTSYPMHPPTLNTMHNWAWKPTEPLPQQAIGHSTSMTSIMEV